MSRMVQNLLKNYHELDDPGLNGALLHFKMDLDRAISSGVLNDREMRVVHALYLAEFQMPLKEDRGNRTGRSLNGGINKEVAKALFPDRSINAAKSALTRTLQSACHKLAVTLGDEYQHGYGTKVLDLH